MHRILILDDEIPSAKMTEQLLQKTFNDCAKISSVQSVKQAVEYLKQHPVDLIMLDLQLKGESGFDLFDKTSKRDFDFICLSASPEYAMKAFEYNACGYLLKPVNISELSKAINVWLRRKSKLTIHETNSIK